MSRRPVVVVFVGLLILGVSMAPTYAAVFQWSDYKTMAQLIAGDFIKVGDKIFEDWDYEASFAPGGGGGQNPDPAAIRVYYGQLPNGDVALQYQAGYSVWRGATLDVFWEYTVSTVTGAPLIHDWSMELLAFGTRRGGSIVWSESLYASEPPHDFITAGAVSHERPDTTYKEVLDDSYSKIRVVKNLSLSSEPRRGSIAHVSVMRQTWSQVPEASSFALFGLGFVGLGLFRRFRKR